MVILLSDVNKIPGNVIKEDALKVGYFFSRNSGHTPAYSMVEALFDGLVLLRKPRAMLFVY